MPAEMCVNINLRICGQPFFNLQSALTQTRIYEGCDLIEDETRRSSESWRLHHHNDGTNRYSRSFSLAHCVIRSLRLIFIMLFEVYRSSNKCTRFRGMNWFMSKYNSFGQYCMIYYLHSFHVEYGTGVNSVFYMKCFDIPNAYSTTLYEWKPDQ